MLRSKANNKFLVTGGQIRSLNSSYNNNNNNKREQFSFWIISEMKIALETQGQLQNGLEMKLPSGKMETEKLKYILWKFPRAFLYVQGMSVGKGLKRQSVVLKITLVFLKH